MRAPLIIAALGSFAAAAAAQAPQLQLFGSGDFQTGRYSVAAANGGGESASKCVASPETLLHAGLEEADGRSCVHTVVEDTPERATVAYSCRGLGSGRTTIVKDNRNHFTIDAQGIRGREPFAMRQEVHRVGECS
jgi:hypothetical protein